MKSSNGKVYLIGAGPGDPDLITVKGRECIQQADVVIYDYLAAEQLLDYCPDTAEVIYVGKKAGDHTLKQEKINDLIAEKAKAGNVVARLKGGDPFIFGRGGEEAEVLAAQGVSFEIVPGVSSAIAAPAYAGIPLTHRKYAASVSFITGHEDPTKDSSGLDWQVLARTPGTLVFLMGVRNLTSIVTALMDNGKPADTPVALVRWGTTPMQQTVTGRLDDIVARVTEAGLTAPCIIVVGGVVEMREVIGWFEQRPLLGRQIVVTRARPQASEFVKLLSGLGAACITCPTIRVTAPSDYTRLDESLASLSTYDWVVFTSVNGVDFFFDRLYKKGLDSRALGHAKTAVIGPATQQRLASRGINSDIVPESYRAESVVDAFKNETMAEKHVLLPRAAEARPILPEELIRMGAQVDEIPVYYTKQDDSSEKLLPALENKEVDVVTFTSSSTVTNFRKLLPPDRDAVDRLMDGVRVAAIGPITAETAREQGFDVHITADSYTIQGLADAIVAYYVHKEPV
ncbi:MAG: uroporphyrinogen-III C-methyltransferase [Thermodesulfobacteriota bacterium]|nr:uroporphyrinogen-III C-methyltransferase [Thermodesulfobacteriota bacterium]